MKNSLNVTTFSFRSKCPMWPQMLESYEVSKSRDGRKFISLKVWHTHQQPITAETVCRDQFMYAPSQWETSLHFNDVSHWPGAYLDWSLETSCQVSAIANTKHKSQRGLTRCGVNGCVKCIESRLWYSFKEKWYQSYLTFMKVSDLWDKMTDKTPVSRALACY